MKTLVEKIIAEIDSGWSPRVAARKAGTTEYMLIKLSHKHPELKLKMNLYSHSRLQAKVSPSGVVTQYEWVPRTNNNQRVDRNLPVHSPVYKRRMSRFGE